MDGLAQLWSAGDGVTRAVALLLLTMSVSAWVLILWKSWVLGRARRDLARAVPAFWAAPDMATARAQLAALDRERILVPMLDAALQPAAGGTLDAGSDATSRLTRRLRDALHQTLAQLQWGQVLLASVGSTAPFIGLFGTVWGIDKVAGPVGEALVMTAAGLAVAIPAVLAYNVFGKWVGACEADLEGWAHDLREMALHGAADDGVRTA